MQYKAVIFDLDGVICHTDHYHYAAWKEISEMLGLNFDMALGNKLRGVGRMESFEIILKSNHKILDYEDRVKYIGQKNAIYQTLLAQMTPDDLNAETRRTLGILRENNIKMAIASSSKNAKFILERIGLGSFFDVVVDGTDIQKPKPHPEVFLKAVNRLNHQPKSCVVVEDAQAGIAAATAGGIDSAAISDAVNSPLATYRLAEFSDILQYVL